MVIRGRFAERIALVGHSNGGGISEIALSPRNYFAAGQPPTLIIQGTNDQDIPAPWSQATLAALQAKGIESKLSWYPGAMHDFAGANLSSAVTEQENWIRHALGMPALP
jgi:dipeptidyl aminopeptidase/acylaminoacyl peptidase